MNEIKNRTMICPMKFAKPENSPITDFNCEGPICAWWREGRREYQTEYYGGTVPATPGYCAILDIGR